MATYNYTLTAPHPMVSVTGDAVDMEFVIAKCLNRIKKTCKGAVVHTLANQVARIQAAQKQTELDITIARSESSGIFGWIAKRKYIKSLKLKLLKLQQSLVKWVCSVYTYFLA